MNNFYANPSSAAGGGYLVYRVQRGGGRFGAFRNFMAPIGKSALAGIKSIAKNQTVRNIAKKAAATGAEILTGVAVDALQGRDIHQAFKDRSKEAALNVLTGQSSSSDVGKRRLRSSSKRGSRKRRKSLKQTQALPAIHALKAPPSKKRRRKVTSGNLF